MVNRQQHMIKLAQKAMENAYAPYSNFCVGVAIRTDQGRYFSGCNVENASYRLTLCAESVAIGQMVTAGDEHIEEIVVLSSGEELCPPCGACRQNIREFAAPDCQIHLVLNGQIEKTYTLNELLPAAFSAAQFKSE